MQFQPSNSSTAAHQNTRHIPSTELRVGSPADLWDGILLSHKLGKPFVIGREPASPHCIQGTLVGNFNLETISRRQGVFQWSDSHGLTYTDQGLNPSHLNSVQLTVGDTRSDRQPERLFSGDTLSIAGKITIVIPDAVHIATGLLAQLNGATVGGRQDFEHLAQLVSSLQRAQDTRISARALSVLADAAIAWEHSPRAPEQLAYLAKLASSPKTHRLQSLLRSRRFPMDNGNSIADGLLCLPAKLSGERIFKEERGEVLDVIAVAPPNNSAHFAPISDASMTSGQFSFLKSKVTRFCDAFGTRHIMTQGSITSCVRAASLLLAMDAAYKAGEAYGICARLEQGARNAGLSDHDTAYSKLKTELTNTRLTPVLTELAAPPSAKELQRILKNGPAMVAISTPLGGHVIVVDDVKTPIFGKAVATIRDTYHGWCIQTPWDTLAQHWSKNSKLLQITTSRPSAEKSR